MATKPSCIICAYNEKDRIANVLNAVHDHPDLLEVIVVDDGSTDGTGAVVRQFPTVTLITHDVNKGKTEAMTTGVTAARSDTIFFVDADLVGITADDVSALVRPVISGDADVSLSLRGNSLRVYRAMGIDFVSGERVVPREVLHDFLQKAHQLTRFGAEVVINESIIRQHLRVAIVDLPHLVQVRKSDKRGMLRGFLEEVLMLKDVTGAVGLFAAVRQMRSLRALVVR